MSYPIWGPQYIDQNSRDQMDKAMALPVAVAGALMPDAHLGYGLPIGGVLALDGAVCPYAVGVDIACRMKLTAWDVDPELLTARVPTFSRVLEKNTFFGVGVENGRNYKHKVFDEDWNVSPVTMQNVDKALRQLGTSGSGNHFVEFGVLHVFSYSELGIREGKYTALMSHSGSRGTGAAVCNYYSKLAKELRPEFGDLAWLELGTPAGDEYWAAMNLMGKYAAANHDLIHQAISNELFRTPQLQIENHHNFAWKENHGGREVIVHRKGATPAGKGVLGVIPGSMGTPAYVVVGKGNPDSLCSASHGAGRVMSRKQAKKTFDYAHEINKLAANGVTVLSAGADEVCGVYKNIYEVMQAQRDLVEAVARFDPVIVKMCGGNERAED